MANADPDIQDQASASISYLLPFVVWGIFQVILALALRTSRK